mgnify:CR=1 FL=1
MPRTPLLASLRRSFRHAHLARATGLPLDVIAEDARIARAGRRRFIAQLGASAATIAARGTKRGARRP